MNRNNLPSGLQPSRVYNNTSNEMQFVLQQSQVQPVQQQLQYQQLQQAPQTITIPVSSCEVRLLPDGRYQLVPRMSQQGQMVAVIDQQASLVEQGGNTNIALTPLETQFVQTDFIDDAAATSTAVSRLSVHDSVLPQKGIQPSDEADYYINPASVQSVVSNDGGNTSLELNVTILIQNGEIIAGSEDAKKLLSYATSAEQVQLKKILHTLAQRKEADISGQRIRNLETAVTEDSDNLSVKKLRTYIADLMKVLYMKEVDKNKSKIKHIWGNQPSDWPSNVPFIDPNNGRKNTKKPDKQNLKLMFCHLLERYKTWKLENITDSDVTETFTVGDNGISGISNPNESFVSYQPMSDTVPVGGPIVQQQESKVDFENMEIDNIVDFNTQYLQLQELEVNMNSHGSNLEQSSNDMRNGSTLLSLGVDTRFRQEDESKEDNNDGCTEDKFFLLGMLSENSNVLKGMTTTGSYAQPVENIDFSDIPLPTDSKTEAEFLNGIAEFQLQYGGPNWLAAFGESIQANPTEGTAPSSFESDQIHTRFQSHSSVPVSNFAGMYVETGRFASSMPLGQHPLQSEMMQNVLDDESPQIPVTVALAASGALQSDQAERKAAKRAQQEGKTTKRRS